MQYAQVTMEFRPQQMNLPKTAVSGRMRLAAFALAFISHLVVLGLSGAAFYKPAQFGVEAGAGSVDLSLVVAVPAQTEAVKAAFVLAPASEPEAEAAPQETAPEQKAAALEAEPLSADITAQMPSVGSTASDGALWIEPRYFLNRPPRYPREAIAHNIQGTVILLADIAENGRPLKVVIERSSGHDVLDRAAVEAVQRWVFDPAHVGTLPVRSRSRIPVNFTLQDQN